MKYSVPKNDGESLICPPWEELPQLAESNHSLLNACDFQVAGESFRTLRQAARRRLAAQAALPLTEQLRIVVAAHQPGFYGPGILYKHRILQELSRKNLCVNFVVDSDASPGVSAKVPYRRAGNVGLKEVVIFPNRGGRVFEAIPFPPKNEVDRRYREIVGLLESLGMEGVSSAFQEFRVVHEKVYREGDSVARLLTDYRRGYYPTADVHESYISTVSQSEEFLAYACDIIARAGEFHLAHNSSLNEYRQLRRIRSSVNPFPDLVREGQLMELPFWGLDADGRRHKLFAGREHDGRFLMLGDGLPCTSPIRLRCAAAAARGTLVPLRIRPRAVCLTMFLRLFVADLFVHGVGGGNYDQVTDKIIEKFYGVPSPRYAVCSRTRFLPRCTGSDLQQRAADIAKRLRQMRHSPERFVTMEDPLAREAVRILSEWGTGLSALLRARLREIRRALSKRIETDASSLERELAEVERALSRDAALRRRDLPYFLYPRSEL